MKSGFTLVETLVVLTISALILSLSLVVAHDFNLTQVKHYLFWKEFRSEFELYESLAREHHSTVTISFNTHNNEVDFMSPNSKLHRHRIKEPRDLSTKQSYKVEIDDDGRVNPVTIIWMVNHQPYLSQKFQLGWGMYTIEDSR